MQTREKLIICVVPLLGAGVFWFTAVSPAMTDWQLKETEIKDKSHEQTQLKGKLADLSAMRAEQKRLEVQIDGLRASVPKSADLDLLMIDLEKMCLESGMDLVGFQPPGKDTLKEVAAAEAEDKSLSNVGSKLSLGGKNKDAALAGPKAKGEKEDPKAKPKPKGKGKQKEEPKKPVLTPEQEAGLSKILMEVKVTGDYPGLITLMNRLESYQRVIGINQLEIDLPEKDSKQKTDPNKQLVISFILTTYYLP